ncbi:unnamed protein product [Prorocentrum cordatum]|uniref:Kinesin light chain n=1 Tax=Prorocentrum cordatum TaxID=2364126 RepID=A0ABN9VRM8_9DINO|nr:unnamed protein product [Polarella glacialis]
MRRYLAARTATLGGAHEDTLKTAGNLGLVLYSQRRTSEALPLLRETMQGLVHVLGRQHPLTLTVMQNLSLAMGDQEPASSEALRLGREAAEGKQLALGSENPDTLEGWRDLATLLERAGRWEEAERFLRQALAGQERLLGFNSKAAQQTLRQLSELLRRQGSAEEAEELRREHSVGVVVSAAPLPDPKHRGPLVLVLLALYVLPACRGCGIGRAAMELWKGFARGSAAAALELELKPAADCWGFFSEAVGMVGQRQQGTDGTAPAQLRYAL